MNWTSIGWCAGGLLIGGVATPLIIYWPGKPPTPPLPVAVTEPQPAAIAVIVPAPPPQPEIHSVPWFVDHQSEIAPERTKCANSAPPSIAATAECSNADRASLHVFNAQLRAKYFGKP